MYSFRFVLHLCDALDRSSRACERQRAFHVIDNSHTLPTYSRLRDQVVDRLCMHQLAYSLISPLVFAFLKAIARSPFVYGNDSRLYYSIAVLVVSCHETLVCSFNVRFLFVNTCLTMFNIRLVGPTQAKVRYIKVRRTVFHEF